MPKPARRGGFTLVELCIVMAMAGVLAAIAWPSWQAQLHRGYRADAVAALTRLQLAQESHRAMHGLYAARLALLSGASVPRSREGLYDIEMLSDGGSGYEALARARTPSPVAGDTACAVLRLRVQDGQADYAPSARCWNR